MNEVFYSLYLNIPGKVNNLRDSFYRQGMKDLKKFLFIARL